MIPRSLPPNMGGHVQFGDRPALVVVDLSLGFTDPESPLACDVGTAVPATAELVEAARGARVPVAFTTIAFLPDHSDAGPWLRKIPAMEILVEGSRWIRIDPRLWRLPGDLLVSKRGASAFHRTDLASWLRGRNVDSVIVVGASTSGCVRATAVDAVQEGWPTFVVSQCVADRDPVAHDASLHDLAAKYADVLDLDEALTHLAGLTEEVR